MVASNLDQVVHCLATHNGVLYAGTQTEVGVHGTGYVYRYHGGTSWSQVGSSIDNGVMSLISHDGYLIAGTRSQGMKTYRLIDGDWVLRSNLGFRGTRSMAVIDGNFYEGDFLRDKIFRNGDQVLDEAGSCIWDFAKHNGTLYACAWRGTYWYSTDNGVTWTDYSGAPFTDYELPANNIFSMDVFKGDLYFGCKGLIRGHTHIWDAPGNDESTISTMINDGNTMYLGIGGDQGYNSHLQPGYVYAYTGTGIPTLISPSLDDGVQVLFIVDGWNIWVYKSGTWHRVTDRWTYKGGTWQPVSSVDVNKDGWKPI